MTSLTVPCWCCVVDLAPVFVATVRSLQLHNVMTLIMLVCVVCHVETCPVASKFFGGGGGGGGGCSFVHHICGLGTQ